MGSVEEEGVKRKEKAKDVMCERKGVKRNQKSADITWSAISSTD